MNYELLPPVLFIFGAVIVGGVILYKTFNWYFSNLDNSEMAIEENENATTTQTRKQITYSGVEEMLSVNTTLGIWSGVKFGFGFAIGVTLFYIFVAIFFGSLVLGLIASSIKNTANQTPTLHPTTELR